MITTIIYEGSWLSFLTVVFEVYERKLEAVNIVKNTKAQINIFGVPLLIGVEHNKAKRVVQGLKDKLSTEGLKNLFSCFLSELDGIENDMLSFIRLVFENEKSVETAYGYSEVLKLSKVGRMVYREKHRMEAFVRFQLTQDDIYYSSIEPDFNVIPLITNHFKKRYADQKWIIYDLKREYGIFYDLIEINEICFDFKNEGQSIKDEKVFKDDEMLYQVLWQDYFKHINIASRKNTKLHLKHVPKRYWKNLVEKF